jgi:hydrogenase maturation protease
MTQPRPKILVACIGNIFLGDDGFGVEVARRLFERPLPDCVHLVDYGIRGLDLAYALLDDWDTTILVDATQRGEDPGTLYVIELDPLTAEMDAEASVVDAHGMDPQRVLQMVMSMGGRPQRTLLVGCEPMTFGPENEGLMGLSGPVEAAAGDAVGLIESLIARVINERCVAAKA